MAARMDCLFCRIASGKIESEIVYEDDDAVMFKDIYPKAATHILIVPRKHIESVLSLDETTKDIPGMLVWKAKQFAESNEIPGYKLTFHVGREGGQEIDHIHLHLMADKELL